MIIPAAILAVSLGVFEFFALQIKFSPFWSSSIAAASFIFLSVGVVLAYKLCSPSSSDTTPIQTHESNIAGWLPPELPPDCSTVTVWFGTMRVDEPVWLAKIPHTGPSTNYYGTNSFTTQITPNLTLTSYHWGEIATDGEVIKYSVKDLPAAFVSNAEKMPDFSPRKRHVSFNSQFIKTQTPNGKSIDLPVWPFVASNRLFVDVMIPFINERRRILMDTNLDNELTNLPNSWDVNYNSNEFEIVNEDTNPVLQIIYKHPNEVQVNGIYVVNGFDIYAAFDSPPISVSEKMGLKSTQMMEIGDFEKLFTNINVTLDTNSMFRIRISTEKTIFKYPSWEYLGQLAN